MNGNHGGNMGAIVDMVEPDCITLGEYRRLIGQAS